MKYQQYLPTIRYSVILSILFSLVLLPHQTVSACTIKSYPMIWRPVEVTVDQAELPQDVTIELAWLSRRPRTILTLSNESELELYVAKRAYDDLPLNRSSALEARYQQGGLTDAELRLHGLRISEKSTFHLNWLIPQSLYIDGTSDPKRATAPGPLHSQIWLLGREQAWQIPITIRYGQAKNTSGVDSYQPDTLNTAPLDTAIRADAIVVGIPFGETDGGLIIGDADITVSSWIRGSGPANITVSEFGYGPDCLTRLTASDEQVFFLKDSGAAHFDSAGRAPLESVGILNAFVGQPAHEQEPLVEAVEDDKAEDSAMLEQSEPSIERPAWPAVQSVLIGAGSIALLCMIGFAISWKRRHR